MSVDREDLDKLEESMYDCWRITSDIKNILDVSENIEDDVRALMKVYDVQFKVLQNGRVISQSNAGSWLAMNGTGTVSVLDSFNVSGISDNGTGSYDMTHAVDFSNDDYAAPATCNLAGGSISSVNTYVGTANLINYNAGGSAADPSRLSCTAHGDIPHE